MFTSSSARRMFAAAIGLAICLVGMPPGHAGGEESSPITAQVKASLEDPTKPFTLVVALQAKEGAGEALEAAVAKAARPTRKEKGCLSYELSRDAKSPRQYLLYERWQDLSALDAHLKSDYITSLLQALGQLTDSSEIRVLVPVAE